MHPEDRVFALPEVADTKTSAAVRIIDPAEAPIRLTSSRLALYAVAATMKELGIVPVEALLAAAEMGRGEHAAENAETIRAAIA